MTRVHGAHAGRRKERSPSARTNHRKHAWKSVFETVTQEKKALRYVASYNEQPPAHYLFVPIGNHNLTKRCKERCQQADLLFQTVSTSPKSKANLDPNKVSHHIHRIGNHFPTDVVEEACRWLGLEHYGHGLFRSQQNLRRGPKSKENQEEIKSCILELFPAISPNDLNRIAKHAWKKGSARVGNSDMPLTRRVQLAVSAYVRHKYTNYDLLWKEVGWQSARSIVEPQTLAKLMSWRGEDRNQVETEEVLREYIVIDSDDDDNEDDGEELSWTSDECVIGTAPPHAAHEPTTHAARRVVGFPGDQPAPTDAHRAPVHVFLTAHEPTTHAARRVVDFPKAQHAPNSQRASIYISHDLRTGYEHPTFHKFSPIRYPVGASEVRGAYVTDKSQAFPVHHDRIASGRYSAAALSTFPGHRSELPTIEGKYVIVQPTRVSRENERGAIWLDGAYDERRYRALDPQTEPDRIDPLDRPLAASPDIPLPSVEHDSPHKSSSLVPRLALGYDRNGQTIVVSSNVDASDRYHDVDHHVARRHESQPLSQTCQSWPKRDYAHHPRTVRYLDQPARVFAEAGRGPPARGIEVIRSPQGAHLDQGPIRGDPDHLDPEMAYHHPRNDPRPRYQEMPVDYGRSRNADDQYVVSHRSAALFYG